MPTKTKTLDNMSKHLTRAETEARQEAEESVMPNRAPKKPPAYIKAKTRERKIWDKVLRAMDGYDILDLLDADTLGLYCSKLARWETLEREYSDLRERFYADGRLGKDLKLLAAISAEMQTLEAGILTYATKLGLTPDGRARLARRLAEQAAPDPDDDLFA